MTKLIELSINPWFPVPENHEEIIKFVEENFPQTSQANAFRIVAMTWNLACMEQYEKQGFTIGNKEL